MISSEHIEFIRLVAGGATYDSAYATSCNKNATSANARSQGSRLASKYAKEIAEAQQLNKSIVDAANNLAIVKTQEMRIISVARRMEILSDIAEGKIPLTKPMVCDGVIEIVPVVPDWMDRKSAIAELNKMDGSYTPIKTETNLNITSATIIDWTGNSNNSNTKAEGGS